MTNPGLISGFLGCLPAGMIPYRSALETARIAIDPARERDFSLPVGLAIETAGLATRTIIPSVFRAWQLRGKSLPASFRSDLVRSVEGRHPRAWVTHPRMRQIFELADQGRLEEAVEFVRQNRHQIESFLYPVVKDLLDGISACPAGIEKPEEFPVSRFGKSAQRGIKDYDRDLFGKDLLERLGARLRPEETRTWKFIDRLPPGARVADWGSGAGIFGLEVKRRRPDLRMISTDLQAPERIFAQVAEPRTTADEIHRQMTFLEGDAFDVALAPDELADLLVSVSLTSWVSDPLRLFAHMYNQVKPNGVMVVTLHTNSFDMDRAWGDRTIVPELVEELRQLGAGVATALGGHTLVVRRPDDRRMVLAADLVGSFYEEPLLYAGGYPIGTYSTYFSFYRRNKKSPQRWVTLR